MASTLKLIQNQMRTELKLILDPTAWPGTVKRVNNYDVKNNYVTIHLTYSESPGDTTCQGRISWRQL